MTAGAPLRSGCTAGLGFWFLVLGFWASHGGSDGGVSSGRNMRLLTWIAGYVTALAWGAGGVWLFVPMDPPHDGGPQGLWWRLALLLVWVALPAVCSLGARRSRRLLRHPLLGGLAFGGVVATAYLLIAGGVAGLGFVFLLMNPIGFLLFFTLPPAYFGWLCLVHKAVLESDAARPNN